MDGVIRSPLTPNPHPSIATNPLHPSPNTIPEHKPHMRLVNYLQDPYYVWLKLSWNVLAVLDVLAVLAVFKKISRLDPS